MYVKLYASAAYHMFPSVYGDDAAAQVCLVALFRSWPCTIPWLLLPAFCFVCHAVCCAGFK